MWGKIVIINLYECDSKLIKSKKQIEEYIIELCKRIGMRTVDSPRIKRFGEGRLKGFSAMQFLETSSITTHFDETKNRAFIDIFSCKDFDGKGAENFSKRFFKAKKSKFKTFVRE